MNAFLYHTLVHSHNNGDQIVTFNRIKRLLSQSLADIEDDKKNFYSLFQLLKLGLIDNIGNNSYSLTPSSLIKCSKNKLTLGVNLPAAVINKNSEYVIDTILGLTLFNVVQIDCLDYNLLQQEYDFDSIISQINSRNVIISSWTHIAFQELGKIEKLELYNSQNNKWVTASKIEGNANLYKAFIHNQFNYNYVFYFKNKYFKIGKEEYEKVNTVKLINANNAFFKYNQEKNLLHLKHYFTYPIYLYKLLFLNHIMNTGQFPQNNQFRLEQNHFKKLTKTLSINCQII